MPKSKNQIYDDEKNWKSLKQSKTVIRKKIPKWFGQQTSEPIGFYDTVVII